MLKPFAITLSLLLLFLMAGCQSQEPESIPTQEQTQAQSQGQARILPENAHSNSIPIISAPGTSASASLIQDYTLPPQSVQDLVNRSRAIVIGTVTAISQPVVERPYDFNPADFAGPAGIGMAVH